MRFVLNQFKLVMKVYVFIFFLYFFYHYECHDCLDRYFGVYTGKITAGLFEIFILMIPYILTCVVTERYLNKVNGLNFGFLAIRYRKENILKRKILLDCAILVSLAELGDCIIYLVIGYDSPFGASIVFFLIFKLFEKATCSMIIIAANTMLRRYFSGSLIVIVLATAAISADLLKIQNWNVLVPVFLAADIVCITLYIKKKEIYIL